MILIINPLLFKLLPNPPNGMALFPFILVREKRMASDKRLIRHERIHLRQQIELLILPFYLLYLADWLQKMLVHRNWDKAYRAICFEREAYDQENRADYLARRRFFSFVKYWSIR